MRARMVFAGMATILAGACSQPPAESALDKDLAANLELALAAAATAEPVAAVASELEAPRPEQPKRRPPPQQEIEPRGGDLEVASSEPAAEASVKPAAEAESEPTFTVSPLPTTWATPVPVSGPVARSQPEEPGEDAAGPGPRVADEGVEHPRGRRPGVIIRGGIGARDPCAVHTGRGQPGAIPAIIDVLINDRSPRSMPGRGNPTMPPRRGGGGIRF